MTLVRTCCCQGCFDNDDCPVAYTGLGDFTYQAVLDTAQVVGNFALEAVTGITANPVLAASACYAFGFDRDKCCVTGASCTYPTDTLVEKYFDQMLPAEISIEKANFPCYTVVRRDTQIPGYIYKKRCATAKFVNYRQCVDVGTDCATLFPDCYQGPAPNYNTDLQTFSSAYALNVTNSQTCGDYSLDFVRGVEFGALTVGVGTMRMRRNGQSTFTSDLTTGSGVTNLLYYHRTNICPGPVSDCGPCTQPPGANGGSPCSAGRCCCRSLVQFTFSVNRVWYPLTYQWNAATNDFDEVQGTAFNWTQTVRCIYEGPVDPRLYGITGTSSIRTFTLLSATIFDSTSFSMKTRQWVNDYCPWELNGLSGTSVGPAEISATTVIDDDCEPCQSAVPVPYAPAVLSLEQAENLGIKRLLTVTRITP